MKIDLTTYFTKIGKLYVTLLSQSVKRQQNYDSSGGYVPKQYASKVTVRRKGKTHQRNVGNKRLYVTGNFAQNAFQYKADAGSLTLQGSDASHPQGVTYADIIAYNDSGSPYLKGKRGSTIRSLVTKIFPWLEADFFKGFKLMMGKDFVDDLAEEVKKQVDEQLAQELQKKIEVNI